MRQVRGSDFPVADILVAVALELCIILVKKIPYKIRTHPDPDLSLAAPQRFKVVKRNFALFYFFAILPALLVGAVLISKNRRLKMANVLVSYFVSQFVTALVVDLMKLFISRPRPDTYLLCGGLSSHEACAEHLTGHQLRNQFRSHPSGGTAEMVAVGVFCALTLHELWPKRNVQACLMKLAPVFWAAFSAGARIVGHAHHPEDIATSIVLGGTIGYLVWSMALRRSRLEYQSLPSVGS